MAAELARYGVPVRIVDRDARRTDKSRALVVWSRSLELLDRAACARRFVATGHQVNAASINAGGRVVGRVGFDGVESPYPYALMLPQSETERLLEEHLNGFGISVERQVELAGFADDGAGVTSALRRPDGREESLRTAWLVGCDGAHSTVRHTLGLPFLGETLQSDWILADVHLAGLPVPASELATYWHEEGVLAVFPISPGRYRVVADIGRADGAHPADQTLKRVQAVMDRRGPGGVRLSDPVWLSAFRINERKVADYRSDRVFVAGDAAHVHSPAGGQGMNTGMQDAFNLAWKLALVCHGAGDAGILLDSYSIERSAVGAEVLAAAGRLTAVATVRSHAAQAVRNLLGGVLLGLAPVRRAMADTLAEVSVGYARSPLNGPGAHGLGGPAPGKRAPPVSGQIPVGAGSAPRFALFAAADEAGAALIDRHRDLLEPESRPPFREGGGIWLVRPDGYVAMVAGHGGWAEVGAYLERIAPRAVGVATSGPEAGPVRVTGCPPVPGSRRGATGPACRRAGPARVGPAAGPR